MFLINLEIFVHTISNLKKNITNYILIFFITDFIANSKSFLQTFFTYYK